jgi:hypothetical protein
MACRKMESGKNTQNSLVNSSSSMMQNLKPLDLGIALLFEYQLSKPYLGINLIHIGTLYVR